MAAMTVRIIMQAVNLFIELAPLYFFLALVFSYGNYLP